MAEEIRRRDERARVLFVGTKGKVEERVVPPLGYAFATIWISGFRRSFSAETILFPLKLIVSIGQSFRILRAERPAVVVGTGGYVAGPVLFMAGLMGIPTLIQEQNSYPGITTRLLSARVDEVHVTFAKSVNSLRRPDRARVTGNPTRASVGTISREEGRAFFGLDPATRTLLVFGGSQGAHRLNRSVGKRLAQIVAQPCQLLWQTGEQDAEWAAGLVREQGLGARVRTMAFIEQMQYAYGAASLAVCRSGATTLAELSRAGVPAVLVPYPHAAADHQTMNAETFAESGAAVMLKETELDERLHETITALLGAGARLDAMASCAKRLAKPKAASDLVDAIIALTKTAHGRE